MEFQNRLRIVVEKSTPLKKYLPQPRAAWHQDGCPGRKFTTWGKGKTRAGPPPQQLWGQCSPCCNGLPTVFISRLLLHPPRRSTPWCPALFLGAYLKQPHRSMEQIESRHKPTHKQTINLQHGSCGHTMNKDQSLQQAVLWKLGHLSYNTHIIWSTLS